MIGVSFYITMCDYCRHAGGRGCRAFPDGLPQLLLDGEYDHRHEYPGDGGIRFEADDEEDWRASSVRKMMDGELEDCEWMAERYARTVQQVLGEARAAAESAKR